MSFCRITGRSRNLPKPHYFPLIPPLSPADARRCCRITGKSYGLPMHHYVPVLLRKTTLLSKCRITKVADMYGKRKHHPLAGFRYVRPIIDMNDAKQKTLIDLLTTKAGDSQFVYTVKERRCSLVFPAQLEHAVRDGAIKDVMLAKDSDTVLLKFKHGHDITVEIAELNEEEYMAEELFEGEGMAEEEKPVVKKKQQFTMGIAKMFEDKEKLAVEEEIVVHKKKIKKDNKTTLVVNGEDWRNLIQPLIENWDWATFEQEAAKGIPTSQWTPPPRLNSDSHPSDISPKPPSTPLQFLQEAISQFSATQLEQTESVFEKILNGGKHALESIPFIHEIQDLVRKLSTGTFTELASVSGMKIFTDKSRFVIGQMVPTARGSIFVPGQMGKNSSFMPGFVVNTNDGLCLIPGIILAKQKHSPVFLPGQTVLSSTGEYDFVPGQSLIPCQQLDMVPSVPETVIEPLAAADQLVGGWEVRAGVNGVESIEKCLAIESDATLLPVNDELIAVEVAHTETMIVQDDIVVNVEADSLQTFIDSIQSEYGLDMNIAQAIAKAYHFKNIDVDNASKIILAITHFAQNTFNQSSLYAATTMPSDLCETDAKNCNILKNALFTAVGIIQEDPNVKQEMVFNALMEIFANLENKDIILRELCEMLNSTGRCERIFGDIIEQNNHKLPNVSKVEILKSAINLNIKDSVIIEKLTTVIEEDLLAPAFRNVSKDNPEFLDKVLCSIMENVSKLTNDQNAYDVLQTAIVSAIKETSEQRLNSFLSNEGDTAIKDLLQEAIGLAMALGMNDTAESLCTVMADAHSTSLLAEDPLTLEILKRLTVMRQLAERQPTLHSALLELKRNPHGARGDPKLRELVRESAVLMVPDVQLQSSENIPLRLFAEHNTLAMEDFLTRNRRTGARTLLISKRGLQAVVPKEASRAVLNGHVAYTLIDETGITHFKPLHVFSALRLSQPTARRFSGYECLGASVRPDQITPAATSDKAGLSPLGRMTPRMLAHPEA